jgi:hypothetical protein
MTSDRKKPGVALWATVVVMCLPILYVLSFGPALSFCRHGLSARVSSIYWPVGRLMVYGPRSISTPLTWYVSATSDSLPEWIVDCPLDPEYPHDHDFDGPPGLYIPVGNGVWTVVAD